MGDEMSQIKTASRIGIAVAGAAAMLTLGMAGPVQAAPNGGANSGCGNYCPTNVGAPSGNGNGNGNATGKPGAGMVGNADSKNPPGQFPNGSDSNNGYECDGNSGIGKTNPAHSGCSQYPPPPQQYP
jgi:hypothetical protein